MLCPSVRLILCHEDRCYRHACFSPQVHFVPDAGTVAQIVYTDDQVRPPQQVVYTADGASYTSVDGPEHTLVYIHPVEAAQAREVLFVYNLLIDLAGACLLSPPVLVLGASDREISR